MTSIQSETVEILGWDDVYVSSNIQEVIPKIQKCFNELCECDVKLKALKFAFGPCLFEIPPADWESGILEKCCSSAVELFKSSLDQEETSFLGELLEMLENALEFISNFESYRLVQIRSLLKTTSEIIYLSYKYYKQSVNEAKCFILKQTHSVKDLFLKILIRIECRSELEETVCDLDLILTYLWQAAGAVTGVDVKVMAELWKSYATLAGRFSMPLKQSHNVALPLVTLCRLIEDGLEGIANQRDQDLTTVVKNLKIISFYLKIVIKMCELFAGCLGDCNQELLQLLCFLSRCQPSSLLAKGVPYDVASEISNHVTIGFEPLINQLLLDRGLVAACSARSESISTHSDSAFGMVYISCSVLKKLLQKDYETNSLWFGANADVLVWIFNCLPYCQEELCGAQEMSGVLVPGKEKRNTDLYEMTLTAMAAVLLSRSPKEFAVVERLLLNNILQWNPWSAMLATDVWCLLARFASADLCCEQMKVLCPLLVERRKSGFRPELCYLNNLVTRLLPLLLPQQRTDLFNLYPELNNTWSEELCQVSCRAISAFCLQPGDVDAFLLMELQLSRIGSSQGRRECPVSLELAAMIVDLWKFESQELKINSWSRRLLRVLCQSTMAVVPFLDLDQVCLVVEQMSGLLRHCHDATCNLITINAVLPLATLDFPPGYQLARYKECVAGLCNAMLTSKDVVTQCHGLEIFRRLARITPHSDLLVASFCNDSELITRFQNYLERKLVFLHPGQNSAPPLPRYFHTCDSRVPSPGPKPKKFKYNTMEEPDPLEEREVLHRWLNASEDLIKCLMLLPAEERRRVAEMCRNLSVLKE